VLIEAGIKTVVYGMKDPNPMVSGQGIELLIAAGIEVSGPLLEEDCRVLNAPFILAQKEKRPFVSLKLALSLDGMLADRHRQSSWITSDAARIEGHRLRARHQAVLVGAETVRQDNPRLTPRDRGEIGRANPIRIILTRGQLDLRGKAILDDLKEHPLWIMTSAEGAQSPEMRWAEAEGARILQIELGESGKIDLPSALNELYQEDIIALFCEGGADLAGQLLRANLVDRMHIFRAPIALGGEAGLPGFSDLGINELSEAKRFRRVGLVEHPPDIEEILEREDPLWLMQN
jgi:diaminohydroxyphosphoribosylaminopyrimidine deaminase/5-amino-6-(5-phosphoribosylamino)uracil reductase